MNARFDQFERELPAKVGIESSVLGGLPTGTRQREHVRA